MFTLGIICLTRLPAALAARLSYLFARNLTYKVIYDQVKPRKVTNDLTNREKSVLGMFCGAIGAVVSNPFEIAMVRQINDLGKPSELKHNLGSVGDAVGKIGAEKPGYFRGLSTNIAKAVVLNGTLIGPYDYLKERMWITFGDTVYNTPAYEFLTIVLSLQHLLLLQ